MEEIFNVKEVAEKLKLHPSTVRIKARQRKEGWFKIGDDWRITETDLKKWIEEMKMDLINKDDSK